MKKLILAIIILLLVIVLGISMYKGINLGKYRISSIEDIKIANNKLDSEIQKVDLLNTTNYVSKKNELSIAINALETKKKEYLDLVNSKTISEIEEATRQEKYEIEFLWTRIGFYAQANNLWLKAALTNPSNGLTGQYDIKITVKGGFSDIEAFIRGIEKDVNLGFRIEEFSMIPYLTKEEAALQAAASEEDKDKYPSGKNLEAKFVIKNVSINLVNLNSDTTASTTNSSTTKEASK